MNPLHWPDKGSRDLVGGIWPLTITDYLNNKALNAKMKIERDNDWLYRYKLERAASHGRTYVDGLGTPKQ